VSFVAITLCVTSQRVFIAVSVYFIMDSARKLLDTPSCVCKNQRIEHVHLKPNDLLSAGGWLVGWLVRWSVGRSVGRSVG